MKHGDRNRAVGLARIVLHDNGRIGPRKALERRPEAVFGGEIPEVENEKDLWEAIKKQEREEKKKRAAAH